MPLLAAARGAQGVGWEDLEEAAVLLDPAGQQQRGVSIGVDVRPCLEPVAELERLSWRDHGIRNEFVAVRQAICGRAIGMEAFHAGPIGGSALITNSAANLDLQSGDSVRTRLVEVGCMERPRRSALADAQGRPRWCFAEFCPIHARPVGFVVCSCAAAPRLRR